MPESHVCRPPNMDVPKAIDAATAGLIKAIETPHVLNTCPHAATRLGVLQCTGCSWDAAAMTTNGTCALESIVRVQHHIVQSNYLFIALVLGGLVVFFVTPQRDPASEDEGVGADLGNDGRWKRKRNGVLRMRKKRELPSAKAEDLRISRAERIRLAVLWSVWYVGNYFFAFLLTHFIVCEADGTVQTHDATVISLQVGLCAFTMWRFHFPSGRLLASRPLLPRGGRAGKLFGKLIMWVLGLLVLLAWVLSRRFGSTGAPKLFDALSKRHDCVYYDLCYAGAGGKFSEVARPTTVLQYLKGVLQLGSALVFLLGGFGRIWISVRIFNLVFVYSLLLAQFIFGQTVMATTGPAKILTGALANDFLEIAIAHACVVVGLCEVWEVYTQGKEEADVRDVDLEEASSGDAE